MAGNWINDDKRNILETFTALAFSLKSYGNQDHKARLRSWQLILEPEMTADEICAAMIAHSKVCDELPTPSQLLAYKQQQEKKITYAEYKHALEQHALEGYPMHGYYGQVIKSYESQTGEEIGSKSYYQILDQRKQFQIEQKEGLEQIKQISQEKTVVAIANHKPVQSEQFEGQWNDWDDTTRARFIERHKNYEAGLFKFLEPIYGITFEQFTELKTKLFAKN